MDSPIHTTTTHQAGVSGIDYSICILLRYITPYQGKSDFIDDNLHRIDLLTVTPSLYHSVKVKRTESKTPPILFQQINTLEMKEKGTLIKSGCSGLPQYPAVRY
jgi:hypothetical protein